jgi:23S rRNA G2445 N2-methylase RlmL
MAVVSLRLANSTYELAKNLSKEDHVSLNQFIATAVSEKVSALNTESYINEQKKRASKEKFLQALEKVPDVEAEDFDSI